MKGIIAGTSLIQSSIFEGWQEEALDTPYGPVRLKLHGDAVFVQRHGEPPLPPHRINHRANIWALKAMKATKVISINSVGSLKVNLKPGSFLIPDDFLSPWDIPTFFDDEMRFMVPEMDRDSLGSLFRICKEAHVDARLGGTYIQTLGPRLETKAEIAMMRRFGHVVGMTMASEATLAREQEIAYASLCSIDNYCNGIVKVPLTLHQIMENVNRNRDKVESLIKTLQEKDFI
jgi:5'-methylthioadenosine phosphorylase